MNQPSQFRLINIYLKDLSFESPNPLKHSSQAWSPKVDVNIKHQTKQIKDQQFEVTITVNVEAVNQDETAFIAECLQSGLFEIEGYDEATQKRLLAAFCPTILFPYARQTISQMVSGGGFPALLLQPVNFDALYDQHQNAADEALKQDTSKH